MMKLKSTFRSSLRRTYALLPMLLMACLCGFQSKAQNAGSYTFTQTSGTYTPITGGTLIVSNVGDSWQSGSIALSPGFSFCGVVYTSAYVTSNGLISLGGTTGPGLYETNGIANNGSGSGIHLCPFNSDMIGSTVSGASSSIRYQLVGNEHIFQWTDMSRWPSTTDRFSFQARLNHVTGVITYVYSVVSVGTSTSYQPVVGIRTAATAGNWQSRFVDNIAASSWAASTNATVTTNTCRFTSTATNPKQPTNGQTYIYTPPPACNSTTTWPTAGTVTPSTTNICVSGNVTLNFTTNTPMPQVTGISYQWQSGPTATGPWTNIGPGPTTLPTYTAAVSANTYFRCQVLCQGSTTSLVSPATAQIVVNNPVLTSTTGASRCGPGSVVLNATAPAGTSVKWYANPTGGLPLFTGNAFTTPYVPSTTTFYAAPASGSSPAQQWVGTGTLSTTFQPNPYYTGWWGSKNQYLIHASEMIAAGLSAGTIDNMGFDVVSAIGLPLTNLTISLKSTTATTLTAWETGFGAPNYSVALYTPTANSVNVHTLTTPFVWDGSSNIVIETCFNNSAWGSAHEVRYSNTSYNSTLYYYADIATVCSAPGTPSTMTSRPNIRFGMTLGCEGTRAPVLATINPGPAVTKTAPSVVCNDGVATLSVASSPMSNYSSYVWSPTTNLYTNAAATIPYTGGNASTVYMKTDVVGQHTYAMMASGTTPAACTHADTARIWVQPTDLVIKGQPDTLCAPSGSSTLKLDTIAGYFPGTIQWQQSTNGTAYTNIAGATTSTYITPNLSFGQNTYYKAVITAGTQVCEQPVKYMVIANPTVVATYDSFNCGPGTVTLRAVTGGNGTARWYDVPTLGIPLGTGAEFTTPFLPATDTFYVESAAGGSSAPPTWINPGTATTTGNPNPFYTTFWGNKVQMMIRASELAAAGYTAGNITHIAFDVLGVTTSLALTNFTIQMTQTTQNALTAWVNTGLQTVYTTPSYNIIANANSINEFMLSTPYPWDGTSNIVIQTCFNNSGWNGSQTIRYNSNVGFNASLYYYADQAGMCTTTSYYGPLTSRPNIRVTMSAGCKSERQPVVAYIHPYPTVDLGPDVNKCVDEGDLEVLDAGVQQHNPSFLWDNGSTSQVRAVGSSGTYSVKVTNQYGCIDQDTVLVTMRENPVVELGNDTTVCNGVTLNLNAGNDGIEYFWNNGQTTQTINVNSPGTYAVFVTNSAGCVKTDTIKVNMEGQLPTIAGIQVSNNGVNTFHFSAINPQNVIGFEWDFGDGSNPSYQATPIHTYATGGYYTVRLKLSSTCGFASDSSAANIVGIGQLNIDQNELSVYPNPTRGLANIVNKGNLRMERIEVYNVLGQVVYQASADHGSAHTLNLEGMASGVYTVQIYTDKGSVARKLEVIK
jgi:hypothetical protein